MKTVINGDARLYLFYRRGLMAGKQGFIGPCPYDAATEPPYIDAWELGQRDGLKG